MSIDDILTIATVGVYFTLVVIFSLTWTSTPYQDDPDAHQDQDLHGGSI